MVIIKILDYIDRWHTSDDGQQLFDIIKPLSDQNKQVKVSFKEVSGVPSSFVNAAFVQLLDYFSFDYIKSHLFFIDTAKATNDVIRKRFRFETARQEGKKVA